MQLIQYVFQALFKLPAIFRAGDQAAHIQAQHPLAQQHIRHISLRDALRQFAEQEDVVVLMKFHPLTAQQHIDTYKQLAAEVENIVWIDDINVTKYMLMSDIMLSDTSSTIYEELLLDKPVITLRAATKPQDLHWCNIQEPEQLSAAYHEVLDNDGRYTEMRRWIIDNYDPYLDGQVAKRMLDGARDFIRRHGVPERRHLNLWRKYTSIKTFGWPRYDV